jgi:hypothetical protein
METISGHTNLCIGVFSSGSCHTVLWRIAQGTHENATTKLNPHKILTRFALMGYRIYWGESFQDRYTSIPLLRRPNASHEKVCEIRTIQNCSQ